jgi:hypothetical protein
MKFIVLLVAIFLVVMPGIAFSTENSAKEMIMNQVHQELAVNLFNQSWDILLKEGRDRKDEDTLVNVVHASLYHWRQIGEPINILRGEWMIAHVYTLLGHKEEALYHAENVMTLKEELNPLDWDLAYCYEAMARVMALWGDQTGFEQYYEQALAAGKAIQDPASRQQFESDMQDEYWFGMIKVPKP